MASVTTQDIKEVLDAFMKNEEAAQRNFDAEIISKAGSNFPSWDLRDQLGPQTNRFKKQEVLHAACVLLKINKKDGNYYSANREKDNEIIVSIATLETSIGVAAATPAVVTTALAFLASLVQLKGSLDSRAEFIKGIPVPQDAVIKMLDSLIMTSVTTIPVVGPFAAIVIQATIQAASIAVDTYKDGMVDSKKGAAIVQTAAMAGAGGWGNYQPAENKDAKAIGGAAQKFGDTKAAGVLEFFYNCYSEYNNYKYTKGFEKAKEDLGEDIGLAALHNNIQFVSAPADMGQAAGNFASVSNYQSKLPESKKVLEAIGNKALEPKKTIEGYFDKFKEIFNLYKTFFETLCLEAVIISFNDFINAFDEYTRQDSRFSDLVAVKKETKIAAIVLGWFMETAVTRETVVNGPTPAPKPGKDKKEWNREALEVLRDFKYQSATRDIGDATFYKVATQKSILYLSRCQTAVAKSVNSLFGNGIQDRKNLDEIVDLVIACSAIVSSVNCKSLANTEIKIDGQYIGVLEKLKYVNRYSKSFGKVWSSKDGLTQGANQDGSPIYYLRYPSDGNMFTGSASVKEVTMVYIFSCVVVKYVDPARLALGLDNWSTVKGNLQSIIKYINECSATMDQKKKGWFG